MATVAILGGGISGLSCAYYLSTLGRNHVKYIFLLEKSPKFGGWIQTTKFPDGAIFEQGPRTLRIAGKPGFNALSLAEELHLSSHILPISRNQPVARKNYVLYKNKLHALPSARNFFKTVTPLSKPLCWYIIKDLITPKSALTDESVYDFGKRRFGQDVADYILDPMCRGVTAGDARELSMRSVLPKLFNAEHDHGSVVKGILRSALSPPPFASFSDSIKLPYKAVSERWHMWSLKEGLHQLVETMACAIEDSGMADIHVNAECSRVQFKNGKAVITVDGETIVSDHVFSCIPAKELSCVINEYPLLFDQLSSINSVNVAVVYLEYENDVLKDEAFGFLVPSSEDAKVLGIVFDSCCFPQLNGKSRTRISCMMGGKWFKNVFGTLENVTTEQILKIALNEVKRHLKIDQNPVRHQVTVQKNCIPQYLVGHHKKLEIIDQEIKNNNLCLSLTGASFNGAGVPDCILNSRLKVEEYLQSSKMS